MADEFINLSGKERHSSGGWFGFYYQTENDERLVCDDIVKEMNKHFFRTSISVCFVVNKRL